MSGGRDLIAGRYELIDQLGRGGMAIAYAAIDHDTGARVARKRLRDLRTSVCAQQLEREHDTLKLLSRLHVAAAHDFGRDESGVAYMTMAWLGGGDLEDLAPLAPERACGVLSHVASALSHSRRRLHRDLPR